MEFAASFYREEVRSGFLVTEKRKKVWAKELEILEKFDEICKKHGLVYYAYYGTLLGAVRHQGFIPWDDDLDVVMFRDDYEKFKVIAQQEVTEPYFYQNCYTDERIYNFSKIMDNRTTAIEFTDPPEGLHQGIFIDIFPFDSVYDGVNEEFLMVDMLQRLLCNAIYDPFLILDALEQGKLGRFTEFFLDFMQKDIWKKCEIFDAFCLSQFGSTQKVNYISSELNGTGSKSVYKDWMKDIIYLPFEHIQIPAPAEYDKVLTQCYGDYHQFVQGTSDHEGVIFDPDMPYGEYLKRYIKK